MASLEYHINLYKCCFNTTAQNSFDNVQLNYIWLKKYHAL